MKNPGNTKGFRGLLLAVGLLAGLHLNGQIIHCILEDSSEESGNPPGAITSHCDETLNYAVDQENLSHHPQLVVWVNFHYIRRNDGTGNFKEPGEPLSLTELGVTELDGVAAAHNLLGHMNVRMGDFEQYNQSNAAHVPESGIRYKLFSQPGNPDDPHGGIFFHESDVFFNLGYNSNNPVIMKNTFTEYGAGYLEFDFCEISEPDIVIQSGQDIVWAGTRYLRSNVVVENGARLTVRCLLGMPQGSIITVEQGGTLIVDEGEITNLCGGTWQGIEVLGNPNTHQYGAGQQGVVELKNGAKAEYADIGVSVFARDNPLETGGGILRVTGATFSNNRVGVAFSNYVYRINPPGSQAVEISNRSFVRGAVFELDDNYPFATFSRHAYAGWVTGISFTGCDFFDNRDFNLIPSTEHAQNVGTGIYSISSRIIVTDCDFDKLLYGINANGLGESRNFQAKENRFINTYVGISARGVDDFSVVDNNVFEVGGYTKIVPDADHPDNHVGLVIDECTGFTVEDNDFDGVGIGAVQAVGILARNTNIGSKETIITDYNEIYSNSFDNLGTGNLANGNNLGSAFSGGGGLTYICNKNGQDTDNLFDIQVVFGQIATNQIDPSNTATGNVFTPCGDGLTHINNTLGNAIRYFFFDEGSLEEPVCSEPNLVNRIEIDKNECSTGNNDEEVSEEDLISIKGDFHEQKEFAEDSHQDYLEQLDNGDTEEMLRLIQSTTSSNSSTRESQLLGYSPYLSERSILAIVDNVVFSSSQKVDVLSANPEVLRRTHIWQDVMDSGFFSSSELDELNEAKLEETERSEVELALSSAYGELHLTANRIIKHYLSDSAGIEFDSLHYYIGDGISLERDFKQVEIYFRQGDVSQALGKLASIELTYEFAEDEQEEFGYWKEVKQIQAGLISSGRHWTEVDAQEALQLKDIAETSQGRAGIQAQNVLNAMGANYFHEPILSGGEAPPERPAGPSSVPGGAVKAQQWLIRAQPNPARGSTTFSYQLPEGIEKAFLHIYDVNGQEVASFLLPNGHSQVSWPFGKRSNGVYYYRLVLPNGHSEAHKLTILR